MSFPRRTALTALPHAALITGAVAGCNPERSSPVGSGDEDSLRFSWWGNPERAETTQAVIDLFIEQNRSEEHTSELQSRGHLVCRLLLEKKKVCQWMAIRWDA